MTSNSTARHILTIDFEEHFHASRFDSPMRRRHWPAFQSRIQENIERLLTLLARRSTRATFFALGWLAERHPQIIRTIAVAGHEIACLGHGHQPVAALTPDLFRNDIHRAKQVLEDLIGQQVRGFRAPSFSITADTPWALPIVAEEGFVYDSSVVPSANLFESVSATPSPHHLLIGRNGLWEVPPTSLNLGGFRIPIGGGGYLRALHYPVLKTLFSKIEACDEPIVMSLRSWEIDAAQPRMQGSLLAEFRHYLNLHKTESRLEQLLADFEFGPVCEAILPIRELCRNLSAASVSVHETQEQKISLSLVPTA